VSTSCWLKAKNVVDVTDNEVDNHFQVHYPQKIRIFKISFYLSVELILLKTKNFKTMSKFQEALDLYAGEMTGKLGMKSVDADLLKAVTKACGPSIYNKDSSKVSCSDQAELDRVANNFCKKKLGLTDDAAIASALKEVCEAMGTSNKSKYRAIFYYMLVEKFGKQSLFA